MQVQTRKDTKQNTLKNVSHIEEGQKMLRSYRAYISAQLCEVLRAN